MGRMVQLRAWLGDYAIYPGLVAISVLLMSGCGGDGSGRPNSGTPGPTVGGN